MAITPKLESGNPKDQLAQDVHAVRAKGYVILNQVFQPDDIRHIATDFHRLYMEKYQRGFVSHRNYKRFSCKIPVNLDYGPILVNDHIHQMMCVLLALDFQVWCACKHALDHHYLSLR